MAKINIIFEKQGFVQFVLKSVGRHVPPDNTNIANRQRQMTMTKSPSVHWSIEALELIITIF